MLSPCKHKKFPKKTENQIKTQRITEKFVRAPEWQNVEFFPTLEQVYYIAGELNVICGGGILRGQGQTSLVGNIFLMGQIFFFRQQIIQLDTSAEGLKLLVGVFWTIILWDKIVGVQTFIWSKR